MPEPQDNEGPHHHEGVYEESGQGDNMRRPLPPGPATDPQALAGALVLARKDFGLLPGYFDGRSMVEDAPSSDPATIRRWWAQHPTAEIILVLPSAQARQLAPKSSPSHSSGSSLEPTCASS